jgi:energy-coupling factor transporter transmembrane protein EcfT
MNSYDKLIISKKDSKEINKKTAIFTVVLLFIISFVVYLYTQDFVRSIVTGAFFTFIPACIYFDRLLSKVKRNMD